MKVGDVIKKLEEDGWVLVRQESSHWTYKKDGVEHKEIASGVLAKIRRET